MLTRQITSHLSLSERSNRMTNFIQYFKMPTNLCGYVFFFRILSCLTPTPPPPPPANPPNTHTNGKKDFLASRSLVKYK